MNEVSPRHGIEYDYVGGEDYPDSHEAQPTPKRRYSRSAIAAVIVAVIAVLSVVVYAASLAVDAWNRSGSSSMVGLGVSGPTATPNSPGGSVPTSNDSPLYSSAFAAPDPIWDDVIAAPMSPVLRIYGDAKAQQQVVPIGGRTENKPFPGVCTVAKGGVLRLYGNKPDNGTSYTAIEYLGRSLSAPAVSGECVAGTLFSWDESTMADSFD